MNSGDLEVEHLQRSGSGLRCFVRLQPDIRFLVGMSDTAFAKMGIAEDDKMDALNRVVFAIIDSHKRSKLPYKPEYFFDSDHVEPSIDKTIDWIKRNGL